MPPIFGLQFYSFFFFNMMLPSFVFGGVTLPTLDLSGSEVTEVKTIYAIILCRWLG